MVRGQWANLSRILGSITVIDNNKKCFLSTESVYYNYF